MTAFDDAMASATFVVSTHYRVTDDDRTWVVRLTTGVLADGRLVAQDVDVDVDVDVAPANTEPEGGPLPVSPYRCSNVRQRGIASPAAAAAVEVAVEAQLNEIADRLGLSPLDLRTRHVGPALADQLDRAAEASEFERTRQRTARDRRDRSGSGTVPGSALRTDAVQTARGIGLALTHIPSGWATGVVRVVVDLDTGAVELLDDTQIQPEEPGSAPEDTGPAGPVSALTAALAAAVADATGFWLHDLPVSPERLLAAMVGIPAVAYRDGDGRPDDAIVSGPVALAVGVSR